ncbi:potassium-transporting ATPase subunit KdpA [Flavobacterium turcicum]|uniref:Potassium-transporting ATPase potassium-binding subunit n=1 Tax=Flavobacterium turcicum TaxID=2764718 RepID=A0ABR7JEX1_9FLAO|nr:potassium-transporting ATPase subunit KdpA [Flavobacterium turcicum]MBC5863056.1 potassium-transporting ATPase subunit KdpA [Flavobacterium turcicum]NHL01788.1 potassium-transporting ATPase subunit KdpA [Flavobacterium turcicum]
MNTELFGVSSIFILSILVAIAFGKYIAKVFTGDKTLFDPIFNPIEKFIFKLSGINATEEMNWKQHLKALLSVNMVWFFLCFFILLFQGSLFLNPDNNPNMSPDLAFNTAISFLVNCNLQHYSGETGLSYLSQMVLMFLQFVSAAVGIAAAAMVFNAMKERTTDKLGNFYNYFIKSCTRILLPLSAFVAILLVFSGTPMTFEGKDTITTLQGDSVSVSRGPAAAFIAIKHIGTNGGGFFGANSAHPFENPSYFSNAVELWAQLIIPFAMIFALGFYLKRRKLSYVVFGVMTIGFLLLVIPTVITELSGNPAITKMGISQTTGAMEGKEVRFGPAISGFWSIATTVISTGSVNSMHDSAMPVSGAMQLLAMMVNAFYGGCGVGWLNFYIFIILAVFISGLMVGRTPEFLGKKIEAREVKIAAFIAILHPLLILSGTALASYFAANDTAMGYWFSGNATGWLNNPGHHGFSEMLYEFTSSAANNGSGFEGLGDNNPFWNITTGIVLLLSRFLPIIGPVAIAGLLAHKKFIPESAGTLKTDTTIFGVMVFAVIAIIAALSFFPALALGPLVEYFTLK